MLSRLAAVSIKLCMPSQLINAYLQIVLAILGATNPLASAPGTIRGDYAIVSFLHAQREKSHRYANEEIRMWAATSAMAPIASRMPRRRLLSGSRRVKLSRTSMLRLNGSTRSLKSNGSETPIPVFDEQHLHKNDTKWMMGTKRIPTYTQRNSFPDSHKTIHLKLYIDLHNHL
jgi:hypothetical protein